MSVPEIANKIQQDVQSVLRTIIEVGIADDANFSTLRQVGTNAWEVTFQGAQHISAALGEGDYAEIHAELTAERSYNARLIDGALIQMSYLFNDGRLVQHRLAYLPSPSLRAFRDDPDGYLRDDLFIEIVDRRMVPFPLRMDFDGRDGVHVDKEHPMSHLTLGDVKSCRIPVSAPVTPRWFTDFILRSFYHTDRYRFADKLPDHRFHFSSTITPNERNMIHVVIPQL